MGALSGLQLLAAAGSVDRCGTGATRRHLLAGITWHVVPRGNNRQNCGSGLQAPEPP